MQLSDLGTNLKISSIWNWGIAFSAIHGETFALYLYCRISTAAS